MNGLMTVTRSAKERLPRLYTACAQCAIAHGVRSPTVSRRIWHFPGAEDYTRCIFFNHNAIGEGFYTQFAKLKIVSPTAMAKLAIDSDSLESLVINREIGIPNREIGRFLIFYQKSEDLPRETWKL